MVLGKIFKCWNFSVVFLRHLIGPLCVSAYVSETRFPEWGLKFRSKVLADAPDWMFVSTYSLFIDSHSPLQKWNISRRRKTVGRNNIYIYPSQSSKFVVNSTLHSSHSLHTTRSMTTNVTDILCDINCLNAILDTLLESLWLGPVDSVFNVSTAYESHRNLAFRGHKHETKSLRVVTSFLHEQLNERMNVVFFKRKEALAFTNELFPIGTTASANSRNLGSASLTHGLKERKWVSRQNQEFNFDFNTPGPSRPQLQLQKHRC